MSTLYPVQLLGELGQPECNPIFGDCCITCGVNSEDPETGVMSVDHDAAELALVTAGKKIPPSDEPMAGVRADHYYAVIGADPRGFCRLVHVNQFNRYSRV